MNLIVTQRHTENEYGDWTDSLENAYVSTFENAGFTLFPISNSFGSVESFLTKVDYHGILLTGGGDVGVDKTRGIGPNQRDQLEFSLLEYAVKLKVPVFGICRGMQSINSYFGGDLERNIRELDQNNVHATPSRHQVRIFDTKVVSELNGDKKVEVNSYHDHGVTIDGKGEKLSVFAFFEPLNLVEGLYHEEFPIAAVQWHPEREERLQRIDSILLEAFKNKELFWK
ncbi:MAG TPA: hypothetical protein EYN69_09160 [Flavobacteriales bacterium]|nr:hypothetical protein [Flavobacteriales bacterium]